MTLNLDRPLLDSSLIFTLLVLLVSCRTTEYTKSVNGQPLMKYYSFRNTEKREVKLVDTNYIYISGQEVVRTYDDGRSERMKLYRYLKFERNGIAFYSNGSKDKITPENIKSLKGLFCFFKEEGDRLYLEIYDGYTDGFVIWQAKIDKEKIYFDKYKLRSRFGQGKLNMEFLKTNIQTSKLVWPD